MTRTLNALTLIAALSLLAAAQDDRPDSAERASGNLPFCPPKTCLYYAGDYDTNAPNDNGVFNTNDTSNGLKGQVWVGVRPDRDATVTGATFNECFAYYIGAGVNPTPFTVQVGIKPGQAGNTVCSTSGNATVAQYNYSDLCYQGSYTIKKLAKSCKLKKGKAYYVNLLPTYNSGDYNFAVLPDVEPGPDAASNHRGWKNDLDDSYFNGAAFGANYQPTWGSGGYCHGYGCDVFSIALTGKK
jgi:hypothetical protein